MAAIPPNELAQIVALHRRGDLAAAESGYLALWRRYGDLEALHLLGIVYRQKGDAAAAVELIGTALQQTDPPGPAIWWYNLANGLSDLGDRQTARYAFATACELDPTHLEMAICAAQAHLDAGDHEECGKRLTSALARHPRQPGLLFIRAKLALAQNDAAACLADCKAALATQPQAAGLHHLAGQALFSLDRPQAAIPCLERALALDGELAEAWNDLGLCQRGLDESIGHFRRALALRPGWALAEFNLAHALLLAGAYREGFCLYEARWRRGTLIPRPFVAPLWQGQSLAPWQTLLLHAEQGIGDTVQMLRFIPAARQKAGCRLAVELPASLLTLAKASLPDDIALCSRLDEAGGNLPPFDRHLPLMSLPGLLKVERQQLDGAPYLTAPPRPWLTDRLPKTRCFGLIWAGNPDFPLDRSRSLSLDDLAPLFQIAGISWISLQKGKAAAELTHAPCKAILDLAADLTDFADTAAVMAKLDGVVAVDTASAHLAAALGCPTWILLPAHFEWRWGRSGSATPWYRSARLIRRGDTGVAGQIAALCDDLTAWTMTNWNEKSFPAGRRHADATAMRNRRHDAL